MEASLEGGLYFELGLLFWDILAAKGSFVFVWLVFRMFVYLCLFWIVLWFQCYIFGGVECIFTFAFGLCFRMCLWFGCSFGTFHVLFRFVIVILKLAPETI